jgi:diadenosine tetraphosphate (Ap4A) HIT family hydrolase
MDFIVSDNCPFCGMLQGSIEREVIASNDLAFCVTDGFPVTDGHALIIPKRHIGSFFEITEEERKALFELLDQAKKICDTEFKPASYNIGINDGPAAGQTVPHVHIHLIPRYESDDEDPRGGVRWVVPDKADYWSAK